MACKLSLANTYSNLRQELLWFAHRACQLDGLTVKLVHEQELDQPGLHHWFVKKAITMSMDKHDKEREMTSVLLSALYSEVPSCLHLAPIFNISGIEETTLQ